MTVLLHWPFSRQKAKLLFMSSTLQAESAVLQSTSAQSLQLRSRLPKWRYGRTSSLSSSCQELRPKTCRSDTQGTVLRPDSWLFSRDGDSHAFGKCCTRLVNVITPWLCQSSVARFFHSVAECSPTSLLSHSSTSQIIGKTARDRW